MYKRTRFEVGSQFISYVHRIMNTLIILAVVVVAVSCRPQLLRGNSYVEPTEEELEQNKNAKYHFSSNIKDGINDLTQERSEIRDGLNVKGYYSYSDGYVKKTVHYEADGQGFRVVDEKDEPLDGPHVNLNGTASVSSAAHGTALKYQIRSIPIKDGVKIVEQA